jgi:hypothetical protein
MYSYKDKKALFNFLNNKFDKINNEDINDINFCCDIINIIKLYKENEKFYSLNGSIYQIIFEKLNDNTYKQIFDYLITEKRMIKDEKELIDNYDF